MSAFIEMQVAVRPPMQGEIRLSPEEIEIGVRDGVFPVTSMVTKVRAKPGGSTLHLAPAMSSVNARIQ